jgi:hypothetical protein
MVVIEYMEPPSDSTEVEPESGAVPSQATAAKRISFRKSASRHLEEALETPDPAEKNYHIRSALQRVMITEQNRSD